MNYYLNDVQKIELFILKSNTHFFFVFLLCVATNVFAGGDKELLTSIEDGEISATIKALAKKPSKEACAAALQQTFYRGRFAMADLIVAYMPALLTRSILAQAEQAAMETAYQAFKLWDHYLSLGNFQIALDVFLAHRRSGEFDGNLSDLLHDLQTVEVVEPTNTGPSTFDGVHTAMLNYRRLGGEAMAAQTPATTTVQTLRLEVHLANMLEGRGNLATDPPNVVTLLQAIAKMLERWAHQERVSASMGSHAEPNLSLDIQLPGTLPTTEHQYVPTGPAIKDTASKGTSTTSNPSGSCCTIL